MCFSQYSQYSPRPVKKGNGVKRPKNAPPTKAELDKNLYGPRPTPPAWEENDGNTEHSHNHDEEGVQVSGQSKTVKSTIIELDGKKYLLTPIK